MCCECEYLKYVVQMAAILGRPAAAFASRGVVPLKADWTNHDPRITQTLQALGRNASPVYALYLPGEAQPRLLPEVLTPSVVLAEIEKLPASPAAKTAITQR